MSDIPDIGSSIVGLANIQNSNFGPTAVATNANTNANTQVAQQQAQSAAMSNQLMQARMPLILSRLHDMTTGAGDPSGVDSNASQRSSTGPQTPGQEVADQDKSAVAPDQNFYQPDKIDAALRVKLAVPVVPPGFQKKLADAYAVDPEDKYGMGPKAVTAQMEIARSQQVQQSQLAAQDDFDKLHAVTDSPEGGAMGVLERSYPETVKQIRRQFAKDPDAAMEEDDAARVFAAHTAGAVHQYTGRKAVKGDDGVYRDEATGITIPGVEKVGLSTEQYLKFAHEGLSSVDMPDGNGGTIQVPLWRKAQLQGAKNINSVGDWVMVRASQTGLPGASATLSPKSAQKQEAIATATAAVDKATQQRATAPATKADGTPQAGAARNAQGNIDPKLTDALNDDKYTYKPTLNGQPWKPQIGATPPPSVAEDMKNQTEARNDLAKTANGGVGASAAALTMYKAAQDVLAKGNYDGGAWNAELAKYSKWLPAGWQNHMTGDYQEIAKYLGNAALQSGKGIFSKMTEKESEAVMHDLNPSPGMDPGALNEMVARGIKTAQYSLDSARRVPAYLAKGKDANQFNSWNQEHFPMEEETKPQPGKPNGSGKPPKYNDAQVKAYMQKYNLSDEQATRKHLGLL